MAIGDTSTYSNAFGENPKFTREALEAARETMRQSSETYWYMIDPFQRRRVRRLPEIERKPTKIKWL